MYDNEKERAQLFAVHGRYEEVEQLNKRATGFGWAILVKDRIEDRLKVVKLPNREEATRELMIEAKILLKIAQHLRHPNLVELMAVEKYVMEWNGKQEERWFLVLQYGGDNLRKRLGKLGVDYRNDKEEYVYLNGAPLPMEEVLNIGMQVTEGIAALHEFEEAPGEHIVHRDIKPENILIDQKGRVRVADFGISKVVARMTEAISVAGTPPYLAPEWSRRRITAASDIYSLGIMLYEMATGKFPFRYADERFYQMPTAPHLVDDRVPQGLSEVIMRALYWDHNAPARQEEALRYHIAREMLQDLKRCYARLHPVPPIYVQMGPAGNPGIVYRDKETQTNVRIFLYESTQLPRCTSTFARLLNLDVPQVLAPRRTFESEEMIGVVVPLRATEEKALPSPVAPVPLVPDTVRPLEASVAPLERIAGDAVYAFLTRLLVLCRQLEHVHRLGVYHGTLTPYNIAWDREDWVIDQVWLGMLAGLTNARKVLAQTPAVMGYLAPEVLRWDAQPTLPSDIYGVGAILYGKLTGTPPMDHEAAAAISSGKPVPPFRAGASLRQLAPSISRRLENIVVQALQHDPEQRQRSMEQLIAELGACKYPDDVIHTLIGDAQELRQQGQVVEAYEALEQALLLAPGSPEVHHARAEIYFLEGHVKWALKENTIALNIEPNSSVYFLQGQCHEAMQDYDLAAVMYRDGLRLEDGSRGRHLLARCLEKKGQLEKAVSEYETAVQRAQIVDKNPALAVKIQEDLDKLLAKLEG